MNKSEILRYLGFQNKEISEEQENLIDKNIKVVLENSNKKYIYKIYDVDIKGDIVFFDDVSFKSKNLADNLSGCKKAVFLCATLGAKIDLLIKKYSVSNMAYAVIIQAVAGEYLEEFLDEIECEIKEKLKLNLKPRFSPGYGDLDISYQKNMFDLLQCQRRIGVSLTDNYYMIPSKSVTAIIGLTKEETKRDYNKCKFCSKKDCEFKER